MLKKISDHHAVHSEANAGENVANQLILLIHYVQI